MVATTAAWLRARWRQMDLTVKETIFPRYLHEVGLLGEEKRGRTKFAFSCDFVQSTGSSSCQLKLSVPFMGVIGSTHHFRAAHEPELHAFKFPHEF